MLQKKKSKGKDAVLWAMFEGEDIRISIRGSITDSQDVLEVTKDISTLP